MKTETRKRNEKICTSEDLQLAEELAQTIERIDSIVFPNMPAHIKIHSEDAPEKTHASYTCIQTEAEEIEEYGVYLPDLTGKIERMRRDFALAFLFPRISILKDDEFYATTREVMISTALHEVRHRVQIRKNIALFGLESLDDCENKTLKRIIFGINYTARHHFIHYDPEELDARIIEIFALHKYIQNKDLHLAAKTTIIQPVQKTRKRTFRLFKNRA